MKSLLLLLLCVGTAHSQFITRQALAPLSNWVATFQIGSSALTNWSLYDTGVVASVAQQTLINSNLNWIGRTNGVGQKTTIYHQLSLTNDAGDGGNTVIAVRHTQPDASFGMSFYFNSGSKSWSDFVDTNEWKFTAGGGSDTRLTFGNAGGVQIGKAGFTVTNMGTLRVNQTVFMPALSTNSAPVSLLGRLSTSEIVETAFPTSTNNAGFGQVNTGQFATNNNRLTLKSGAVSTNFTAYDAFNLEGASPTFYNSSDSSYIRIGVNPIGGGPQFQLWGATAPFGLAGNSYFDTGTGIMYFRWNNTSTSLDFPFSSQVPNMGGWDTGSTPGDTVTPVLWLHVTVDSVDSYIPIYR